MAVTGKIRNIFVTLLLALTIGLTAVCLFTSFGSLGDKISIGGGVVTPLLIVGTLFFCVFILIVFRGIDRLGKKGLTLTCALLFAASAALCAVVTINFQSIPISDSYRCVDTAMSFAKGDFSEITPDYPYYSYFQNYSNNNMLISVLTLFYKALIFFGADDLLTPSFVLSACAIFLGIALLFFAVKKLCGLRKAAKLLLLCVLNPIFYLYIPWIYTISLSLPIITGIILLCVCTAKSRSVKTRVVFSALLGALSAFAALMRVTSIFPVIAYAVILIVNIRKNPGAVKKALTIAASFAVLFVAVYIPASDFSHERFKQTLSYNYPITHWVMMGAHGDGTFNAQDSNFTHSFATKDDKVKANIDEIKKTLAGYTPAELAAHAGEKIGVTFADGTNGYPLRLMQNVRYTKLYEYVVGSKSELLSIYCQVFRASTYLFMLFCLIKLIRVKRKERSRILPMAVTMLGAFVFYIFWEAKADYSTAFLPVMLPLMCFGADYIGAKLKFAKKCGKRRFEKIAAVASSVMIVATVFGMYIFYSENGGAKSVITDISVLSNGKEIMEQVGDLNELERGVDQAFYTSKKFNSVIIGAQGADPENLRGQNREVEYLVTIYDDEYKALYSRMVGAPDVAFGTVNLNLDKAVNPEGNEKYHIGIRRAAKTDAPDTVLWNKSVRGNINNYKGKLLINGVDTGGDLKIKVTYEYVGKRFGRLYLLIAAFAVLAVELFVAVVMFALVFSGGRRAPPLKPKKRY